MFGISLILFFVAPMQSYILSPAVVLWGVVIVQAAIAFAAPSTLFGHWKDDRYKEKLEWDAFTHFLSDMAMIQKYAPADLSMWGDWLVYGTALGVGDKVEKAMKALNIRVADTGLPVGASGDELCLPSRSSVSHPQATGVPEAGLVAVEVLVVVAGLAAVEPAGDDIISRSDFHLLFPRSMIF